MTSSNSNIPANAQVAQVIKPQSLILGMISGTSADAINAALVRFEEAIEGEVEFELLDFQEFPLPAQLRHKVLDACASLTSTRQICELNFELAEAFATAANTVTKNLKPETRPAGLPYGWNSELDLIASHGQTVWHQVEADQPISTLQLAEPGVIAERTGTTVAANFRVADVAAGGQGAPLVSFFDYVFFADPHKNRALQNIGGIGNVTFLAAGKGPEAAWAFDTGPGNMLMDFAAHHYTQGQLDYDKDGRMAAAGEVDRAWLEELLAHPYFAQKPPKTTGRELFGLPFWNEVLARAEAQNIAREDVLATLTAFTAASIARSYVNFGPKSGVDEVIVSGGGALNPTLIQMLSEELGPKVSLKKHDEFGLAASAKEAVAFALFGYELLRGRAANLPSCTGASHSVLMGQLTPGRNFARLIQSIAPQMARREPEGNEGELWQPKSLRQLRLKPKA